MQRALLNSMPDWALFLVFVAATVGLALLGLHAVNRWLSEWKTEFSGGIVSAVAAMVMTFFALMLAFAIVTLDQHYEAEQSNASAEANSLSEIARDSMCFPTGARAHIQKAIADYVVAVQTQEFPAMRVRDLDPTASPQLDQLFAAMQRFTPVGQTQVSFYDSAVAQINQVVSARRDRVDSSNASLPGSFVFMILFTGMLSIAVTFFTKSDVLGLEVALVAALASVVAVGLLTTFLLEYPFSGSVSVSSDVYTHGYLSQLVATYR